MAGPSSYQTLAHFAVEQQRIVQSKHRSVDLVLRGPRSVSDVSLTPLIASHVVRTHLYRPSPTHAGLPTPLPQRPATTSQVLLFHLTNHYALIFGLREWCPSSSSGCRTAAPGADFGPRNNDTGYVGRGNGQAFQRRESEAEETLVVTASEASASCVDAVHTGGGAVGRSKGGGGSRSSKSGGSVATARWKRQILTARRGQRPTAWMDFEDVRKILLGWEGYKIMAVEIGKKGAPR